MVRGGCGRVVGHGSGRVPVAWDGCDWVMRISVGGVVVLGSFDVARASDGHLEGINVKTLLVRVGQQPHEIVLLQTLTPKFAHVNVRTRSTRIPDEFHND